MPKWTVELDDGTSVELENPTEPTDEQVYAALKGYQPESPAAAPEATAPRMPPAMEEYQRQIARQPPPGMSPWGAGDQAEGFREMVGTAKTPSEAFHNVLGGMTQLGLGAAMALPTIPGRIAYGAAADVVAAGQNMAHEMETEDVPKAEYGGNILYRQPGRLDTGETPLEEFHRTLGRSNPNLAVLGHVAKMGAEMAPFAGAAMLPSAYQKLISLGFTLDMIYHAPQQAWELGGELGLPKEQQNPEKIAELKAALLAAPLFIQQGGKHAFGKERPHARSQPEATTVHGDVLSQPINVEAQVSPAQGEPRVQSQTAGGIPETPQAPQGEVSLTESQDQQARGHWEALNPRQRADAMGEDVRWWVLTPEQKIDFAETVGITPTGVAPNAAAPEATTAEPPAAQGEMNLPAASTKPAPAPAVAPEVNADTRIADLSKKKVKSAEEQSELVNLRRQRDQQVSMQFDLAPEDVQLIDEERKAIDTPIDIVSHEATEGDPFSKSRAKSAAQGNFMRYSRTTGAIEVLAGPFKEWINSIPPEQRGAAVKARINEERWHKQVIDTIGDRGAEAYFKLMTGFEKAIEHYQYTGQWKRAGTGLSDTELGHEAVRRRLQQLEGSTPGEIAEAALAERWGLKSLDAMARIVRRAREELGTDASREQTALINRVQRNLDFVRNAIAAGAASGAMRRTPSASELIESSPEDMVEWKRRVQYGPHTSKAIAERLSGDDVAELSAERDRLRDEYREKFSQMGREGKFEDEARMSEAQNISFKAQTLNEIIQDASVAEPGARNRVKVKREDGTTIEGNFSRYIDFGGLSTKGGRRAEIEMPDGSHMMLRSSDKVVEGEIPSFEEWQAESSPGARRRGRGRDTPLTPEEWQDEYAKGMLKLPSEKTKMQEAQDKLDALRAAEKLGMYGKATDQPILNPEYPVPEGKELDTMVTSHLEKDLPSYKGFLSDARVKWGPNIESGTALEIWTDKLVDHLVKASGKRLGELVNRLRLRPQVLGPERTGIPKKLEDIIPDARSLQAEVTEANEQQRLKRVENLNKRAGDLEDKARDIDKQLAARGTSEAGAQPGFTETPIDVQDLRARAAYYRNEANKVRTLAEMVQKGASIEPTVKHGTPGQQGLLLSFEKTAVPVKRMAGPKAETPQGKLEQMLKEREAEKRAKAMGESYTPSGTFEAEKTFGGVGEDIEGAGQERPIRARAISAILEELSRQALGEKAWNRKELTIDDVRWSEGGSAYRDVPEDLIDEKVELGQFLTENAGVNRATKFAIAGGRQRGSRESIPESVTKRLVAMVDTSTGEVHVVSAYRHGRQGAVMINPLSPGKDVKPITEFGDRFRPIHSILLDEPVKDFHKTYESLSDYNEQFGEKAKARSEVSGWGTGMAKAPEGYSIPGTEGIEATGAAGLWEMEKSGVLEHPRSLTPMEARRVYEVFKRFESPMDAHDYAKSLGQKIERTKDKRREGLTERVKDARIARDRLVDRTENYVGKAAEKAHESIKEANRRLAALEAQANEFGVLKGRDMMIISALRKFRNSLDKPEAVRHYMRRFGLEKGQFDEAMRDAVAIDEIYRYAIRNPTSRKFIRRTTQALGARPETNIPGEAPGGRELSTLSREEQAAQDYRQRVLGERPGLRPSRAIEPAGTVAGKPSVPVGTELSPGEARTMSERIMDIPVEARPYEAAGYRRSREAIAEAATETAEEKANPGLAQQRRLQEQVQTAKGAARMRDYMNRQLRKERGLAEETKLEQAEAEQMTQEGLERADVERSEGGEAMDEPGAKRRRNPLTGMRVPAIRNIGSWFDGWMSDRIWHAGGDASKEMSETANVIIDRTKKIYGDLTKNVVDARSKAGGARTLPGIGKWLGQVPSPKNIRAVNFANKLKLWTHDAATANSVGLIEGEQWDPKTRTNKKFDVPDFAKSLQSESRLANLEIGHVAFSATGKARKRIRVRGRFERHTNPFGYDVLQGGPGVRPSNLPQNAKALKDWKANPWNKWIDGNYAANRGNKVFERDPTTGLLTSAQRDLRRSDVENLFIKMREALNEPAIDMAKLDRINQDMVRFLPNAVTHIKHMGRWQEVMHANLFNYLENAAQRAAHIKAFREQFPNSVKGKEKLATLLKQVGEELTSAGHKSDLLALIKSLQGHPSDSYVQGSLNRALGPTTVPGAAFRYANQTVGNTAAKLALTGQMFVQAPETVAGATPVFFGYKNWARGMALLKDGTFWRQMEQQGNINRVLYDYTWNPNSPIRSGFRLLGSTISKTFGEQFLNELQEASAAATAHVVTERIMNDQLSSWEKRQLPQTFKAMGFNANEVAAMMTGDKATLEMFKRRAAAFLTGGNKAIAEGSRLGANRLFNSVFRFNMYPMVKMNQFRKVGTNFADAWSKGGTKEHRIAATEQLARFLVGTTAQGAMVSGLSALMFGGVAGLKTWGQEKKDEPVKSLGDFSLAAIGGPMYLAWRGMRTGGLAGIGEQATRSAFPYSVAAETFDMFHGSGKYEDSDFMKRLGIFVMQRTPGLRALQTGFSFFGLGQQNKPLDTAITALNRWKISEYGLTTTEHTGPGPDDEEFRRGMKTATEAIREGDRQKYYDGVARATGFKFTKGADIHEAWGDVAQSLRARKKLMIKMKEMNADQLGLLRERIGAEAVERLQHYDGMLEIIARSGEFQNINE